MQRSHQERESILSWIKDQTYQDTVKHAKLVDEIKINDSGFYNLIIRAKAASKWLDTMGKNRASKRLLRKMKSEMKNYVSEKEDKAFLQDVKKQIIRKEISVIPDAQRAEIAKSLDKLATDFNSMKNITGQSNAEDILLHYQRMDLSNLAKQEYIVHQTSENEKLLKKINLLKLTHEKLLAEHSQQELSTQESVQNLRKSIHFKLANNQQLSQKIQVLESYVKEVRECILRCLEICNVTFKSKQEEQPRDELPLHELYKLLAVIEERIIQIQSVRSFSEYRLQESSKEDDETIYWHVQSKKEKAEIEDVKPPDFISFEAMGNLEECIIPIAALRRNILEKIQAQENIEKLQSTQKGSPVIDSILFKQKFNPGRSVFHRNRKL